MKTYPFGSKKENKFPKDGRGIIIKEVVENESFLESNLIEFDLDVIKEYFPEADDRESQEAIIESILPAIVRMESSTTCLGTVMPRFLAELKANWKPETKTETGYGYHGSSKGDKIEYTLYFDCYRFEWTTKNRAFQGFVFKEIDKFLKKGITK